MKIGFQSGMFRVLMRRQADGLMRTMTGCDEMVFEM